MAIDVTEKAQPYTPICVTVDTLIGNFEGDLYKFYIQGVQAWSGLYINEARIAPSDIAFLIDQANRGLMTFCYAKGLPTGSYLMMMSVKMHMKDNPPRIYHWVLTVKP